MKASKPSITKRQKELLSIIYQYIKNSGYPPTFEEMKDRLGVISNQSIVDLLAKLAKGRFIQRNESVARSIAILPFGYDALGQPPLMAFLGSTTAGAPIEPIEIAGEWRPVSMEAAMLESEIFLLKIHGDSMINAGIDDGDVILVQSQREFVSGTVVLADVSGEKTVKRFISEDKPPYVYLKPENPSYRIIPFKDDTQLVGKVISVLKDGYWKPVR